MKEICNAKELSDEMNHESIKNLISEHEISEKDKVLKYLKSFEPDCAAGMSLMDEVTGQIVDSGVEGFEDGTYYWDTRHIYHFEKYNLKLNDDFITHILSI